MLGEKGKKMAFTDVEVKEAHEAVTACAKSEDLFRLGLMYSTELEDRVADFVEAHKWFNLAALLGSKPAKAYRDEIAFEMSNEDVSVALKAPVAGLKKTKPQ